MTEADCSLDAINIDGELSMVQPLNFSVGGSSHYPWDRNLTEPDWHDRGGPSGNFDRHLS